jgi:hypothetical protein
VQSEHVPTVRLQLIPLCCHTCARLPWLSASMLLCWRPPLYWGHCWCSCEGMASCRHCCCCCCCHCHPCCRRQCQQGCRCLQQPPGLIGRPGMLSGMCSVPQLTAQAETAHPATGYWSHPACMWDKCSSQGKVWEIFPSSQADCYAAFENATQLPATHTNAVAAQRQRCYSWQARTVIWITTRQRWLLMTSHHEPPQVSTALP